MPIGKQALGVFDHPARRRGAARHLVDGGVHLLHGRGHHVGLLLLAHQVAGDHLHVALILLGRAKNIDAGLLAAGHHGA